MSLCVMSATKQAQQATGSLGEYRRKRSFDRTPEPEPDGTAGAGARFVVHEHHAKRLHWDLRLEHDGALMSWAIPNGIPQDPKHNRKAVHVEDHPLSYIDFHGTIPVGNYGAGQVTIWDKGVYECVKWEPGKVVVIFHGEQLQGRYALFRVGPSEKDWMIHRMDAPRDPGAQEIPELIQPMLARLSTLPADESEWAFEVKWDGVRAIARSQPGRISFINRKGDDITAACPELRALNRALGSHEAILDGEIVAFDDQGRPSSQALRSRMRLRSQAAVRRLAQTQRVTYLLFDLLWLDGHSLMELPYTERRARLQALNLDGERWRTPEYQPRDGTALLAASKEQGLEGIVAKRLDSPYTPGERGGSWLKIKSVQRQELDIGGRTEGKGSRSRGAGAPLRQTEEVKALLESGRRVRGGVEVEVDGRTLKLTNLKKVLYPSSGFTKADLIGYYAQIAPVLLAHLHDRPLTLKRYPNGVQGEYFYEKQSPAHRPEWVKTTGIWSERSKREIHYTLCQDLPTLVWLANLADIELHPSLSLAGAPARPTTLAFDLDPGPPASIVECCEVALELHDMFEALGLRVFAKTSGSKGLQVYVPLNAEDTAYEQTKPLAHAVADLLQRRRPELVVSEMAKGERTGKVLIDWSQNDAHKTTVSVYSLRASEHPTVSTPVRWSEITACREARDPTLLTFEVGEVLARVAEHGDLFAEAGSLRQQLPALGS
jgi:DNA ligase D-like protein (predicted polymerase)/DNA ligase D-like protein (predicted 3'-phosphoesterase)